MTCLISDNLYVKMQGKDVYQKILGIDGFNFEEDDFGKSCVFTTEEDYCEWLDYANGVIDARYSSRLSNYTPSNKVSFRGYFRAIDKAFKTEDDAVIEWLANHGINLK